MEMALEGEEDDKEREEGIRMSLQAAYAYLLGKQGLMLERYKVYAGLKRSGYVVQRRPAWYAEDYTHYHSRLSVQQRLMGPSNGTTAIKAAERFEGYSDGELDEEANETEKEWEARSYYLRKRLQ